MSYIDELNAELGLGDETPTIGSPKLTEQTLETADLPEIQPAENPLAPPIETIPSTAPSVTAPPPSPSVAQTPSASVQLPSTPSATVPTAPVGQGSIYKTALATLGQSTSAPENPVERANIDLGFTKAPILPTRMQENPIDKANRELGLPSSVPYGDTRDTQGPGHFMPSFYDTNVPTETVKPQKGILTEAIHAPIYGAIQLGQVAAGLVAIAGDAFKSDAISNLARGIYDKTTKMMEPFAPSVGDIREISGVGDAIHFAVSQIGQMLPFMIGTMGAGGAISKLMLRTLGPSIIEKATASALAKGLAEASVKDAVGKAMADLGIMAGRAGMVTSSLGLSAGTIASDRMENGLKVLSSDLLWAIPGGLLYTLPEWRLADRFQLFGKAVSDTVKKEGIDAGRTMFIKEFGKQALLGGATMGWEAIINEAGAGRAPFTYDTMWKAINGFIGGGLASGVMGAGVGLLFKTPLRVGNEPVGEKLGPPPVPLVGPEFGANLIRPELAEIGRRVFAPEQPSLPPGQGFNLVNKPESVLRKAWNVPPESNPDIYTLQEEGRFRPVGQGPTEVMPGQVDINRYQNMLNPVKGEGFVTQPVRQVQAGPAEVMTRDAQNLANSAEWAPLREVWNKLVMGEDNPPQLLWGGKFPEHLLYDERQGARGLQAPWVDTEITSAGHIVHTDFDGGKLESLFDKNMKPGKEFIPIRYTAPNGDSTILRRGEPLPQSLMDTIHTFIAVRNRALSEASGTAETPPPQLGAEPVPVTPPKVEGVEYVGVQGYKGLAPDQYMFNDLKTGSSFVTDNLSTEAIMRGRNRKRAEFQTLTPLVVELGQAMDQGLEYDLIANMRKQPPPAAPIEPVGGVAYSTGQEVTFKRDGKIITGTFNEMNNDGTLSLGNRPGEPTNMWEVRPEEVVTPEKKQVTAPAPIPVVPAAPERIPGFARHMVFRDDGHLNFRLGSVEEQITHRTEAGRMTMGIIPGLVGEVWVDANTNEVYSMSMYDRKLKGEDVRGIPLDQLDGAPVEGWKNRVANIDPKFDISEKIGEPGPIRRVPGMTREAAMQVIKDLNLKIPGGIVNLRVFNSREEILPEDAKRLPRKPGEFTRGMYVRSIDSNIPPDIYIFSGNIANPKELTKTVFHELFGHLGFEKVIGPERLKAVTKMVHELYTKEELGYIYRRYGLEPNTEAGDYTVALEKIAEVAEPGLNATLWDRFRVWFKERIADIFGNEAVGNITEDEIRVYLWRSRELMQQESVPSMAQVYNSMTKLISMRMWNMQLPDGPAGVGSFMREDSSPSHVDAAENLGGWRSWFQAHRDRQKNFGSGTLKDLGIIEAMGSLPHWVAMKFPDFKEVAGVQWDRQDKRNRDRIYLMQDPKSDTGDNPYIARKHTEGVDRVIIWSDQNNFYLQGDEQFQKKFQELNGRAPAAEEIQAYHGWKQGFDRAADYAISKLRESAMKLYYDQPWYDQFKGVVDNTLDPAVLRTTMDSEQFKDLQKAVTKTSERMTHIDEREAQLKDMNFYAPHVRGKGEYVVRVFDTNAEGKQIRTWVERFENATDAEKARVRLAQDYKGLLVEKTFEPKTTEFVYGGLDVPAMESFLQSTMERAKGKFGIDEVAADKFMGTVLKAIDEEIMARGFRQQYIHRHQGNVIGGYRTEGLHQVFFDYMSGLSGSMTKLDATYDFHRALQNIDKVNERGLYEYATRYVKDMLRNSDSMDRKLGAFKTLPYAWYLAANLRLAATQMFQNAVTAYPILARLQDEAGVKGSAALRLGKAMVDITHGKISETETRMLQDAYEQGETMANYIQEIKGKVEGGWAKTYFMKLMDVASIPFAGMERFNRRTSLLAAFRLFTEAGKPYDQAYESAKEFVRDAHYAYGLSNYPQLLRDGTPFSKIAGMAYVFKSFPHNYVLSMLHFAKDKDGKLALGVMMRSVAMLAALGGLGAVPFIDDLLEEYEQHFGDPVRSKIRTAIKKYGGDMLGQVGMEGLPALAGIDMSGSTKMQIPIPGVGEFDPSTFTMGVWGGLIDKGKKALDFASNSQWSRAIEAASPVGVEMMLQSARRSQEGLKTTGERPILDVTEKPIMPTAYETGAQVAGFRPERIAEIQKERRVSQNVEKHFTEQRQNLSKQLRMAQGDPAQMESVKRDIQTYNLRVMRYGGVIPRISPDSLLSGMKPETRYMKNERVESR